MSRIEENKELLDKLNAYRIPTESVPIVKLLMDISKSMAVIADMQASKTKDQIKALGLLGGIDDGK